MGSAYCTYLRRLIWCYCSIEWNNLLSLCWQTSNCMQIERRTICTHITWGYWMSMQTIFNYEVGPFCCFSRTHIPHASCHSNNSLYLFLSISISMPSWKMLNVCINWVCWELLKIPLPPVAMLKAPWKCKFINQVTSFFPTFIKRKKQKEGGETCCIQVWWFHFLSR